MLGNVLEVTVVLYKAMLEVCVIDLNISRVSVCCVSAHVIFLPLKVGCSLDLNMSRIRQPGAHVVVGPLV